MFGQTIKHIKTLVYHICNDCQSSWGRCINLLTSYSLVLLLAPHLPSSLSLPEDSFHFSVWQIIRATADTHTHTHTHTHSLALSAVIIIRLQNDPVPLLFCVSFVCLLGPTSSSLCRCHSKSVFVRSQHIWATTRRPVVLSLVISVCVRGESLTWEKVHHVIQKDP